MHSAFMRLAHIASDFTCVYCTAAGTIFGTTDVYELSFFLIFLVVSLVFSGKYWVNSIAFLIQKGEEFEKLTQPL